MIYYDYSPRPGSSTDHYRSTAASSSSTSLTHTRHYGIGPHPSTSRPNRPRRATMDAAQPRPSTAYAGPERQLSEGAAEVQRRSPLRILREVTRASSPPVKFDKNNVISRMLSRTRLKPTRLPSFDESFDVSDYYSSPSMVTDFEPLGKRARDDPFTPASPSRKVSRTSPPTSSPRAYKQLSLDHHSCPPRASALASNIPLPPSPSSAPPSNALDAERTVKLERFLTPPTPDISAVTPAPDPTPRGRVSGESTRAERREVDVFQEFDRLFADFPHSYPTRGETFHAALIRANTDKSLPALVGSSASSATTSSYASRPFTPDTARMEGAIAALQNVILTLQSTSSDHATYILRQADLETRLQSMDRELGAAREENVRLEVEVRREREDKKRLEIEAKRNAEGLAARVDAAEEATSTAQTSLHHLQLSHNAANGRIATLDQHLREAHHHNTSLQTHIGELEGEVTRLTGAFDILKSDYARREDELRKRLDEAEFMHKALKESGARLGRELEGAKRRAIDVEKRSKGFV